MLGPKPLGEGAGPPERPGSKRARGAKTVGEDRVPRSTGRFAFLRHLFSPFNLRRDLCSIVFVVLGRDRKLRKGRGVKLSNS